MTERPTDAAEPIEADNHDKTRDVSESVGDRTEGARLIVDAFAKARSSGREDWDRMTTAVLKNRILSATNRQFRESDWGASSFRDFLAQFPEIVELDMGSRPVAVRLISDQPTASSDVPSPSLVQRVVGPGRRIRKDLWEAAVDYSSGKRFVWDGERAVQVPVDSRGDADQQLEIPSVSEDDVSSWRESFAKQAAAAGASAPTLAALDKWRLDGLSDRSLPAPIRRYWNAELKQHVVAHLVAWFEAHGIPVPHDLVTTESRKSHEHDPTEDLRDLVITCVRAMTRAELEEIRLPPAALLRSHRGK